MKEHVIINQDRTIVVPDSLKRIGIQYDHNVNTITFDCPRYPDGDEAVDMSKMPIYINYMRPNKSIDCSLAENVVVDEADETLMHFDWKITRKETLLYGVLSTLICVKKTDVDGIELYHWNTDLIQKFTVGTGMECEEQIADENPEIISQLLARMEAVDTRTSPEALQTHVNAYMTENGQGLVDDYMDRETLEIREQYNELKGDLDEISEIKQSRNHCDNTRESGYINYSNGNVVPYASLWHSAYMPITARKSIYL